MDFPLGLTVLNDAFCSAWIHMTQKLFQMCNVAAIHKIIHPEMIRSQQSLISECRESTTNTARIIEYTVVYEECNTALKVFLMHWSDKDA